MPDASSTEQDLLALERFVVENDDLLELEERIGRFNIFDALGIARAEIRHSNFLAWLLDPAESHGQGDLFLKTVLMDLLKNTPREKRPLSPIDLDGVELQGIELRREWSGIDLLIYGRDPPFVVTIENKVDSSEHSDQLQRYETAVNAEFAQTPKLFVFLTPDGDEPSDPDWTPYSYASLHAAFSRVRNAGRGSIGGDVSTFLDHYLNLIGTRFMDAPDIEQLCKRIYTNHRRAIDLIVERAGSPSSGLNAIVEQHLSRSGSGWIVRKARARMTFFVPAEWVGRICDKTGEPLDGLPCDLFIETHARPTKLVIRLVVGRGENLDERRRFIELLLANRERLGLTLQRRTITNEWTRVYSKPVVRIDDEDAEINPGRVTDALDVRLAELMTICREIPLLISQLRET